jgi:Ca2+/Na+ antiporter
MLRPEKSPTKARTVAILATVIPQIIVAIAAIVFQLLHNAAGKIWVSDISNICFIVGLDLIGAAILASVGFALARKDEALKGAGLGICIAFTISIIEFGSLEWLGGV